LSAVNSKYADEFLGNDRVQQLNNNLAV